MTDYGKYFNHPIVRKMHNSSKSFYVDVHTQVCRRAHPNLVDLQEKSYENGGVTLSL